MQGGVGPSEQYPGVVLVEGRAEVHHCRAQLVHGDGRHHQLRFLHKDSVNWLVIRVERPATRTGNGRWHVCVCVYRFVGWLDGCFTSQRHASVYQGRV